MKAAILILASSSATAATAQMHHMDGMTMPMPQAHHAPAKRATPKKAPPRPANNPKAPAAMPAMDMPAPAAPCAPEHAAMGHCQAAAPAPKSAAGTDLPAGTGTPPAPPATPAAARFYDPAAMARADRVMRREHGGMRFGQIMINLAEVQARAGRDGYRWDADGWFGGDAHRLVVKSEGDGAFGAGARGDVQALYAKAIDPYWNLQAGVRRDLGAGATRSYAAMGVEGLAPYWFDMAGTVFLSDKGDVVARAEAWYDQRITQRAVLQPRLEVNLAAQDMPGSRIGAGLSDAELGVRLRYEVAREFAPYVGVAWERRFGATARYARAAGDDTGGASVVIGIRAWF